MSKFKSQGFFNTFKNARKGLRLVLKSEMNIRVHFVIAVIVLALALLLQFDAVKFCILLLTIGFVMVTEMLNSAIEFGLDAVFRNKYSKLVGMAKDISAGAVMFATFLAIIIGVILFGHELIDFVN
ncbi:MAG: diacylglycerol kinase family protein [Candidatus Gastranaerophilales bacterium]